MLSIVLFILLNTNYSIKNDNYSYWDGSLIKRDNFYYLFHSRMSNHCGLDTWQTNSECVYGISDNPYTNFTTIQTVIEPMCHNPSIHLFNSTYYLYYIGLPEKNTYNNCSNGITTGKVDDSIRINPCFINVIQSYNLIHWSNHTIIKTIIHIPFCPTNPTVFYTNNTYYLFYRAYSFSSFSSFSFGEYIFLSKGDNPYHFNDVNYFWNPIVSSQYEDPYIFSINNSLNNLYYLFLNNKFNNATYIGGYLTSEKIDSWKEDITTLYDLTKYERRERPFIYIINNTDGVLYNAVKDRENNDKVYIISTPFKI